MRTPELKPCPSCRTVFDFPTGIWKVSHIDGSRKFYIMCPECEAMTPDVDSEEEAAAAWNSGDIELPGLEQQGGNQEES